MANIKIALPENFPFSARIPVRIGDINYGGHLGNDAVLSFLHEARLQYFSHLGFSETDAFGVGMIMTDAVISYKGEGFYGDLMVVETAAGNFSSRGFDLYYRIHCEREGKTLEIAHASTGILCFDYQQRKVMHLPEKLKEKLQGK